MKLGKEQPNSPYSEFREAILDAEKRAETAAVAAIYPGLNTKNPTVVSCDDGIFSLSSFIASHFSQVHRFGLLFLG